MDITSVQFYPTVLPVAASYYVLFAAMGAFMAIAVTRLKRNLRMVVAGLVFGVLRWRILRPFQPIRALEGGFPLWTQLGFPVEGPAKVCATAALEVSR